MNEKLKIIVPASTANLGAGFDSIGMAVTKYLTVEVHSHDKWECIPVIPALETIERDEHNLIVKTALAVAKEKNIQLPPCKLLIDSDIPLTRGLGSSASAIVAGIELANELGNLQMTKEEKLRISSIEEGHPDNVGASIYGGVVIGCLQEQSVSLISIPACELDLVAIIPHYELKTSEARSVLPNTYSKAQAVTASAVSNVLVAALFTKNWQLVGEMMDNDLFHQPYRISLVEELKQAQIAKQYGAFGVCLSGAGPTVLCFAEKGMGETLQKIVKQYFPTCDVEFLQIEQSGSYVEKG